MKKIYNYLRILLGLAIIFFIFYKIGFIKIGQTLAQTNLFWVIISFLFLILSLFLNTINLKILFNTVNPKIRIFELFKYFSLARTFSMFLPGRLGDFSLLLFLKHYNIDLGRGSAIMVMDKLITFALFSIFGIIGIGVFIAVDSILKPIIFLILLILVIIILLTS